MKVVEGWDQITRAKAIDLLHQLLLHIWVSRDQVNRHRQREGRRLRPSDEVLVHECSDVAVGEEVLGESRLSRVQQCRQEVLGLTGHLARPLRDDGVDPVAQLLVHLVQLVVGGAGDPLEYFTARVLEHRGDQAQCRGEGAGEVHLEGGDGVGVLPEEAGTIIIVVVVVEEAELDAESGLADDVDGEAQGELGEWDVFSVALDRGDGVAEGGGIVVHGGDKACEVGGLVKGGDDVSR